MKCSNLNIKSKKLNDILYQTFLFCKLIIVSFASDVSFLQRYCPISVDSYYPNNEYMIIKLQSR